PTPSRPAAWPSTATSASARCASTPICGRSRCAPRLPPAPADAALGRPGSVVLEKGVEVDAQQPLVELERRVRPGQAVEDHLVDREPQTAPLSVDAPAAHADVPR